MSNDGSQPAAKEAPPPPDRGRERFATAALLGLAVLATGALVWSTRGGDKAAEPTAPTMSAVASNGAPEPRRVEPSVPRPKTASDVLDAACPGVVAPTCECRGKALERGFSLADPKLLAALLLGTEQDAACAQAPAFAGLKAEALARTGDPKAGDAIASALSKGPADAHALFADAYQTLLTGDREKAPALLEKAEKAGRGAAVHTLRGVWQLQQRKLDAAKASFERALELDAEDVDAMYNLAVRQVEQNGYNKPRSLLLKVLKLRPDHLDARFALASLTHKAGATAEANRHQALLEALAPTGDARVLALRELMKGATRAASSAPAVGDAPEFHIKKK